MLVSADFPVLAVERAARTPAGLQYLVELADAASFTLDCVRPL